MPKKETQGTGQNPEKIMTRYDMKMQRRKEQKERALREERIGRIVGIVLLAALVCFVLSFPIRSYLTVNGTFVRVNGENISRVEFDYNYQVAKNNYLTQYGAYLSYFGLDTSQDLTNQMYSDTLTWGDYFQELAVGNMARNKSLVKEAAETGFSYDLDSEYQAFTEALEEAAAAAGYTVKNYVKELYGAYATPARIKPYVEEGLIASAYAEVVAERLEPTQEEIQAYYEENRAVYDSVDYYAEVVTAELPTEPTELADPVEETEEEEEETDGEEAAYEPSEAEIAAAMEIAKAEAEKKTETISEDGELNENVRRASVSTLLTSWLFDDEREPGDTTVIEDATNNRYYAVGFEKRYLNQTPSADLRVVITAEGDGQAVLDEWMSGDATEESFAEICDKYNDPAVTSLVGGLVEGAVASSLPEGIGDWINEEGRTKGDTIIVSPEDDSYSYVVYYVAENDPQWMLEIGDTLNSERLTEYMQAFVDSAQVEDSKNNLKYLEVRAQEASAAEAASEESGAEDSEEAGSEE